MKNVLQVLFLVICLYSCSNNSGESEGERFEFIQVYTTDVTVGGVVGTEERTFEVGEIYEGTDSGGASIKIRIAEHSERNEDCPDSWCYQEFLDIPREYLREIK
ncbi:hypothetical protein [Robiginitalea sp. SC105]|uniref:hypothetical protein n=1 Tax=Robiginitalea sp. SC105 TaxID=2762332 RepID=UPI001639ADA7|nr:hypothetical protein [Robiginitalea sp. SC105]MBC2838159.1 hypothetical protein [Robiginitalea sp. SC105]